MTFSAQVTRRTVTLAGPGPVAAASIALSIRLPTIDSNMLVADSGVGQPGVLGEDQLDVALGRDGRLGDQQRGDLGRFDALADGFGQPGGLARHLERVADRRLLIAELDQARDGVHAICELVLLGAQGVGERIDAVELAQESFQLGPVAQRHHCAQISSVPEDRHAIDRQDVLVGDDDGVGPGQRPGQQVR